jgi:hypothetical protein
MAARFEVSGAFDLKNRELFVLAGAIQEGMASSGMIASLEGAGGACEQPVHSVELLGEEDGVPGPPAPCLTFHCRDRGKLGDWMALDWKGKTLVLTW